MDYARTQDEYGQPAVCLRPEGDSQGITVTAIPDLREFRIGTSFGSRVLNLNYDAYLALGNSAERIYIALQRTSGAHINQVTGLVVEFITNELVAGGRLIQIRRPVETHGIVVTVDQFLCLADDPYLAVTAACEAAGLDIPLSEFT